MTTCPNLPRDILRLEVLRFPLIMLVLYIHASGSSINVGSTAVGLAELPSPYADIQYFIIKVARLAVPLFFMSSGFLFFRNGPMDYSHFSAKIISRGRTLLIPFLLWNTGLFLIVSVTQQIPQLARFFNSANVQIKDMTNFEILDAILGITRFPISYQFWFIRDLIVLVLCSPVVYVAIRIAGPLFVILLYPLWVFRWWGMMTVPDIEPAFFFVLGAYCGIKNVSLVALNIWGKATLSIYGALLVGALLFRSGIVAQILHSFVVLFGVASALYLSERLISNDRVRRALLFLGGMSFFVFATHEPLMTTMKKVAYRYIEMNGAMSFAMFAISPLLVVTMCIAVYLVVSRLAPKTLRVLTGGRTAR